MISDMRLIKYIKARPGFLELLAGLALGDVGMADCPLAVLIKTKDPLTLPTHLGSTYARMLL